MRVRRAQKMNWVGEPGVLRGVLSVCAQMLVMDINTTAAIIAAAPYDDSLFERSVFVYVHTAIMASHLGELHV